MRTLTFRKNTLRAAVMVVAMMATSGCGNYRPGVILADPSSYQTSSGGFEDMSINGGHPDLDDYTCPESANIISDSDHRASDPNQYTACISKLNVDDVMVFGRPSQVGATRICAFPVRKVNDQNIFWQPISSQDTRAIYSCVPLSASGMKFSFTHMSYNSLIIVPENQAESMRQFLRPNPNLALVPARNWPSSSTGAFR